MIPKIKQHKPEIRPKGAKQTRMWKPFDLFCMCQLWRQRGFVYWLSTQLKLEYIAASVKYIAGAVRYIAGTVLLWNNDNRVHVFRIRCLLLTFLIIVEIWKTMEWIIYFCLVSALLEACDCVSEVDIRGKLTCCY